MPPLTTVGLLHEIAEGLFGNNMAQVFENTVKMFVWISQRCYEVILYRSLHDAANRLNSLAPNDFSEIAHVLSDVLFLGSIEIHNAEESFLVSMNTSD